MSDDQRQRDKAGTLFARYSGPWDPVASVKQCIAAQESMRDLEARLLAAGWKYGQHDEMLAPGVDDEPPR